MSAGLFRTDAVAHYENGEQQGDVLRYEKKWVRLSYAIAIGAAVVGFLFLSLFSVDEYATGPAVVRLDGRRMLASTGGGSIDAVDVKPGQPVEAGAILVRLYNVDEMTELDRATKEFNANLARVLRDPNDREAKANMPSYRSRKEQAQSLVDQRLIRAPMAGYVTDVRVRVGQHVTPGELLLAVAPKENSQVSLDAMVSADYRPMLAKGAKMRFELDGFHYEYADLEVEEVSTEAIGTAEVMRYLGHERADSVNLDPGAKVRVSAKLPAATFTSEGQPYGYFDGLTGNASIRVRREPLLVMLLPALRAVLPAM
jgi:multidrug efflux pump subunit AcrA (membrane-fusion protein)